MTEPTLIASSELPETVDAENLKAILDSLDALVYVADMDSHEILYINDYGRRLWGASAGRKCFEVMQINEGDSCPFCTNPRLLDSSGRSTGTLVWELQNTVNQRWYQCRDQAIPWTNGRMVRLEIATDITERKQMEEELKAAKQKAENLANIDALTGLNNRRAFFGIGEQALRYAQRKGEPVALVLFDLDYFKEINDSYGHFMGDQVLVTLAGTCQALVRDADLLARIGGEEFAVLMVGASHSDALHLAERLREAIGAQRVALPDSKESLRCTASFGVASSCRVDMTLEKLLSCADDALYGAKDGGRNRVRAAGN